MTLEYSNKKDKITPFETFLKYSREKIDSSKVLSRIIRSNLRKSGAKILDIGSGDGSFLKMSLQSAGTPSDIEITLLEPSKDLLEKLKNNSKEFPKNGGVNIINSTWEKYKGTGKFDFILASHLYNIRKDEYHKQLKRMLDCLEPNGVLVFILGGEADPQKFQMKFKTMLFGDGFKPTTIDEIVKVFQEISGDDCPLMIERYQSKSEMKIPVTDNRDDAITIIEFALNKFWQDIPADTQEEILNYIINKNERFETLDEFALVRKLKD